MTDKKVTDGEIVKALECCKSDTALCNECPYDKIGECIEKMCADSIDLITRQQAEIEKNENIIRLADKTIETANAEIERLKNAYKQVAWERDIFAEDMKQEIKKDCSYLMLDIKTIKAEAYKEFAEKSVERVEKAKSKYQRLCKEQGEEMEEHMHIHFNGITKIINNLLKEKVGEDR